MHQHGGKYNFYQPLAVLPRERWVAWDCSKMYTIAALLTIFKEFLIKPTATLCMSPASSIATDLWCAEQKKARRTQDHNSQMMCVLQCCRRTRWVIANLKCAVSYPPPPLPFPLPLLAFTLRVVPLRAKQRGPLCGVGLRRARVCQPRVRAGAVLPHL